MKLMNSNFYSLFIRLNLHRYEELHNLAMLQGNPCMTPDPYCLALNITSI